MRYMHMRFRKVDKLIFTRAIVVYLSAFGKFGKWRRIDIRPSYEEPFFIKGNIRTYMPIAALV